MSSEIPKINNVYINSKGIHFANVREIAFKKNELMGNLGLFVRETTYDVGSGFFGNDMNDDGVYIYQDFNDKCKAYRIYKSFANYGFNGYYDDILIDKLMQKQDLIKLTNFPTGVVTLDGRIIGQEITYYPESITLYEYFSNNKVEEPLIIYKQILLILKELYENGVAYIDIHPKNFLLNPTDGSLEVNLIDFDYSYIKFDSDVVDSKNILFNKLVHMLNELSCMQNIELDLEINNFEETLDKVNQLIKKK